MRGERLEIHEALLSFSLGLCPDQSTPRKLRLHGPAEGFGTRRRFADCFE